MDTQAQIDDIKKDVSEILHTVENLGYEYKKTTADLFTLKTTSSSFSKMFLLGDTSDGKQFYVFKSDGTSPNGVLVGKVGDLCLNGPSGQPYYCTADGTSWTRVTTSYREIKFYVYADGSSLVVGNDKKSFHIGPALDGFNLTYCHSRVMTAGVTNETIIQIHNVTDNNDMLSTTLRIDSGETGSDTAATQFVVNTSTDDVAVNDVVRIDITQVSTTAPKGLEITLGFTLP